MNQSELLQIVQRQGVSARVQGDEVKIKTCIFCGNPNNNLELNAGKGVFKCWACQESGRLQDLLADRFNYQARISVDLDREDSTGRSNPITFGKGFVPATKISSAVTWLAKRHIAVRDIKRYGLQVCVDEEHEHYGRITFPLRSYWDGRLVGYNSRGYVSFEGPKYLIELNEKVPVGYRHPHSQIHIAVEGIFDAIRIHQAGYNALCLLGSGSNKLYKEWAATIPKLDEIVLLLDGDKVGRERANALKHITAVVRDPPAVLHLPEPMDPADLEPSVMKMYLQETL